MNASANVTAAKAASPDDTSNSAPAASPAPDHADTPATTSHLSPASRFLGFLQHLETEHPEETKRVLNGIADRLHFDAKFAGPIFGNRLNDIADRFQKAADSGDLSSLVPQNQGFGHHAMRAYQTAAGNGDANAAADAGAAVAGNTTPPVKTSAPATATAPADTTAPTGTTAPAATQATTTTGATADTTVPATPTTDDTTSSDDAALAAAGTTATAANTAPNAPAAVSGSDQDVEAAADG